MLRTEETMSTGMKFRLNDERNRREYSFLWFIENYSYSLLKYGGKLVSPVFSPEEFEGTSWVLRLYPRELSNENAGTNSIYLIRSVQDSGPEEYSLKFEISVNTENGSILFKEEYERMFEKGTEHGFEVCVDLDELFQDTLCVCCKMWMGVGRFIVASQCSARTRIGIEKISFLHTVKDFSTLKSNDESIIKIPLQSEPGCIISNIIFFNAKEDAIAMTTAIDSCKYLVGKETCSLLDKSGSTVKCFEDDHRFNFSNIESESCFTRDFIKEHSDRYLSNNKLYVICECTFYTGVEISEIQESRYKIPLVMPPRIPRKYPVRRYISLRSRRNNPKRSTISFPSESEEKEMIDNDECLTDIELKEKVTSHSDKSYPNDHLACHLVSSNEIRDKDQIEDRHNAADELSTCQSSLEDNKALS